MKGSRLFNKLHTKHQQGVRRKVGFFRGLRCSHSRCGHRVRSEGEIPPGTAGLINPPVCIFEMPGVCQSCQPPIPPSHKPQTNLFTAVVYQPWIDKGNFNAELRCWSRSYFWKDSKGWCNKVEIGIALLLSSLINLELLLGHRCHSEAHILRQRMHCWV